ncbi:MAG: phosphoenolpyruvate synthase, partial [Bacteroidales bacterium]|nr:phosphoenolpyruvate synthase [Bacteroidales bacterium]
MYIKAGENKSSRINYKTLMQKRIRRVLMICSSYDAYILEEDGRIEDQIYKEYLDLNLSNPPAFVWANSNLEALSLLENDSDFDLIISMFNVGTPTVFEFSKRCKNNYPDIPFILLINFSKELTRIIENEDCTAIDQIFSWHGNADLILAIIKLFEDRFNADEDILSAGVQSILLVEDSVRFYSTYLPAIYKLVLAQSAEFLKEALNEQQQKLRKRARPKILLATNYLEAVMLYEKYKKNLLGVISDVAFVISKNDPSSSEKLDAGIDLCKLIKSDDPYMPFLLQSSQEAIRSTATELRVGFILKHSKTLLIELTEYISEEFVFGDFVFRDLKNGEIIGRAKDLKDMEHLLMEIPSDVLLYHTSRNRLSKWMYSRGLFSLATKIRDVRQNQFSTLDQMRHFIVQSIIEYRIIIAQGIIARFDPKTYSQYIWFARLGEGSLGGKARGLAFLNRIIQKHELVDKYPGVKILVPRTVVVATDYFDEFIKENGLQYVINADISDEELLSEFVSSRLPEALVDELRFFLEYSTGPLAVRSSSKLEDSHYQPFAGIYSTYMIPHTQNQDQMLRLLGKAIKSVYASIYFASSKTYIQATSNLISEEKMAVVIQDICGTEDKGHFFPTISGVARSVNYYPIGDEKPEEGIVNLAYGLGRLVVEGGKTLRFSPAHPKHVLQLSTDSMALRETQNEMYALDLQPEQFKTSIDESINLKRFDINQTKEFRNIKYVASTWDAQSEMLIDNSLAEGRKVITFAHILKYDTLPLAEIVTYLLEICQREMCMAIELEFSVNMDVPKGEDAIFNLLQIRPITESQDNKSLDWEHIDTSDSLIYAEKALGVGLVEGVTDMIYVREENFDNSFTMQIAEEIGQLNSILKQEKRDCVLLGPGRWGTSDMFLGIPVKWSHISQAKVIVECGMENF